jgi:cysteine synthase A
VVMFALEWCEFCWSVRQLFARLGIAYRSVDLDSVEYQEGDRGGKIRAVVRELTGAMTIPQIFVGGKSMGGCTEVFDAFKSGALQVELKRAGAGFDEEAEFDPYSLLPTWLHSRKRA